MKRIISLFLIVALAFCMLPVSASAGEAQLVHIVLIHKESNADGVRKNLSVIEAGEELLFSGEDLAELGGFAYRIEKGSAYFTRGMKTLRVDLAESRLYPMEEFLSGKYEFAEKVQQIDGVYYFPGSEMLPWLNVTCFLHDGELHVHTDELSIWEIIPQFAPDEFAFDFTACCEELGENGKYLKARAYIQDEGISGVFFDLIPYAGEFLDYYDLFEDALQDQSAAEKKTEKFLEEAEDVAYWMDIVEDYEAVDGLPDQVRVFCEAAKVFANNAISFAFELGTYIKHFYLHDKTILTAMQSMNVNAARYGLPDAAQDALSLIEDNYSDYYSGIGYKMLVAISETSLDGLADTAKGLYKAAVLLVGFADATAPDWAEGINRVSSYDIIAEFCLTGYDKESKGTHMSSIRNARGFAYMYLYACEQNWKAMADYAEKEGKLDLQEKYKANAEAAEEWQWEFLKAADAEQNDSHEYGDATGGMKQEYTDQLKDIYSTLPRYQSANEMLFDETCWIWNKGVTTGSSYTVLFHADGTLNYCKMSNGTTGNAEYRYENDVLTIDGIEYVWQGDQFVSTEKFAVNGSDEPEDFYLYPDEDARYYQFVPSYSVGTLSEELQAQYGTASYTEFISCIGTWTYTYPETISGFLNATSVDLNMDGKEERIVLLADSGKQMVMIQVYRESNGRFIRTYEGPLVSLDYCTQQNISLFYNESAGRCFVFVDACSEGAYTGNDSRQATIYDVDCTQISIVGSASEDRYGTSTDDIGGLLEQFDVPYAKNCAEIYNITSQSQYTELLEIRHRYYNADAMGGWSGREHHLQLLTPENRDQPTDAVQNWTITVYSYQGFTEYREETWTVAWEAGREYEVLPVWQDGIETGYCVMSYEVDTQEHTISVFMDYPEGDSHWKKLMIDLSNNTYHGIGYTEFGDGM